MKNVIYEVVFVDDFWRMYKEYINKHYIHIQACVMMRFGGITNRSSTISDVIEHIELNTNPTLDSTVYYHLLEDDNKHTSDMRPSLIHNMYYDIHIVNYAMNDVIYNATNMMRGYSNDRAAKKRGLSK